MRTYTLRNASGLEATVTDLGAIVMSLRVPDRDGRADDVVLGYDTPEEYLADRRYLGAVVGRYANRIAHGRFTLDGVDYQLATNDGRHHLHGGPGGFHRVVWDASQLGPAALSLRHVSPDGHEGYPGTLYVDLTYDLSDRQELVVSYRATTDKATPVNLTQHSYFNLAGRGRAAPGGQRLAINAGRYVPVDETLIPTDGAVPVDGTRFDLRQGGAVTPDLDHSFVLERGGPGMVHAARLEDPVSGRTLDVHTTEPGLHVYTGFPPGVALETHHFPDSPNRPDFPTTILRPGSVFRSRTVFAFGLLAPAHDTRGS